MVLDASLLNTQHYKVWIKGKVEQSREGVAPPLLLGVVAIEKGAFGLPSTMVANYFMYTRNIKRHIWGGWNFIVEYPTRRQILICYDYDVVQGAILADT